MSVGSLSVLSDGFSSALAQPLKKSLPTQSFYAPGYTGSPRKFLNTLIYHSSELSSCSIQAKRDGTACSYMAFLLLMVMIGGLVPVITTIYCCGFCIGRFGGERMKCCGSACKQPNCGGTKPSTEYGKKETRCCVFAVFFLFLVILTTALLGFLSTYQMSADVQSVIDAIDSSLSLPTSLSGQINASVVNISFSLGGRVEAVNQQLVFSKPLLSSKQSLKSSLTQLKNNFSSIRSYVEHSGQCSLTFNSSSVTYDKTRMTFVSSDSKIVMPLSNITCCTYQSQHDCLLLTSTQDCTYGNYTTKCPCCCTCLVQDYKIEAAISRLPTDTFIEALDSGSTIDSRQLNGSIMNFTTFVSGALDQYSQYFDLIDSSLRPVKGTLGNQAGVIAGSVSIWAFTTIAAALAVCGFLLSRSSLWWTAYTCGWISNFVFFVLFGVSSLIVMPFGDICQGLPLTTQDPVPWLVTFTQDLNPTEINPVLLRLNQDCLVRSNPNGQLWEVVGYGREKMYAAFSGYNFTGRLKDDLSQLRSSSSRDYSLHTGDTESRIAEHGMPEGYMSGLSSSSAYGTYAETLSQQWNETLASMKSFQRSQEAWEQQVQEAQTKLKGASSSLQLLIGFVVDSLSASGNCTMMNKAYMDVREPICDRLSKSLDSMWVLFFIIALEWYPMFIIICRGVKHSQQRRGVSKVDPSTQFIPSDITGVKEETSKGDEDGTKESLQVVTEEAPRKKKKKKSKEDGDEAMARKRAAK
ncbi:hypothetical protein GUITHDRAFT_113015 [Guillardia theta CCMP2712]|uniref:Uncharacterized protein n=2 Tax=Guillardia theta TaxID=55529 RepID=L1IXK6_GUITC|nr:hypothetical protein GUITHDRAFT_113015 [Guillardia theta CCMP2712]EKX41008.1 hypothetical protein GUITHDRAFT_113015 [Guillardia theta CCMP2712]|mmetsp:Transcript_15007/g.50705  ORF Transcript_15007/g.50705 Transcript_15007/m.50705 type:complete len:747 (+) Transcript_15007:339-2579(+)|eukprot:XP_005827988.1 hypothetical protein GUITHDRAFT_113015 [Guillardia theta CCMP2712]